MSEAICRLPATELSRRIRRRDLSAVEVVDAFLDRIDERNDVVKAYITVTEADARAAAAAADRAMESGTVLGPLHGVPIGIKDLQPVKGVRTTLGLQPLANHVADRDSAVVARLKAAGAVILGKTNLPELAHKGVSDNYLFGPTATPFDLERTAGGSSGGSAAAVADGLCALAQGSDGSGSIRVPAAFCGVYGLKPSFGLVPFERRPDGFVHDHPYNHIGPMARSVEDAALMLDVMAGPHPRDPHSLPSIETAYLEATQRPVDDLRVAYCPDLDVFTLADEIRRVVDEAVETFEQTGATVEHVPTGFDGSLDALREAHWTLNRVWNAEEADIIRDEYGVDLLGEYRDQVSTHIVERMEQGREINALEYRRADLMRTKVFDTIQDLFETHDLLFSATVAIPPFDKALESPPIEEFGEEIATLGGWLLTFPFNLTGHPAASVPAGFTKEGLPVGLQVVGRRFDDETVLAASAALERLRPWHDRYPLMATGE